MYGDDPNGSAAPGAIPPIDPSLAGNPDAQWVPPWLQQPGSSSPAPVDPYQQSVTPQLQQAPSEIQMPDDFVGKPAAAAPAIVPDVNPDAIINPPPPWLAQAQHDASAPKLGAVDYALSQELGEPTSTGEDAGKSLHAIAIDPKASVSDRQLAWKQMTPEERTNLVNNGDPQQLALLATSAMSPEELGTISIRHQQAQIHEQSAQQLRISMQRDEDARRDFQQYQQALQASNDQTAQLAADAAKIAADSKVDPNEHGVLGFLKNVVLGGIGGAMSQYTGGRNLALEELDKTAQRRIDQQKASIAGRWQALGMKRNIIAETLQHSGDLYHASEAYRISQYDRAINELQTQMQDYDPQGTTALRQATMVQQVQAQRGAALATANQQFIKNHLEQAKADNEAATLRQTVKHQNDETAIARGHLSVDYSKNARDQKEFDMENAPVTPEQARLENPGLPDAAYPKTPVSRKVLKAQLESYGKGLEAQGKANENAQKQSSGQVLDGNGKPYLDAAGKPVQINPEVAKDLNERTSGGQAYLDEMSQVKRMLAADPSTFDRAKWAELNSHLETAAASWTQLYGAKASSRELEAAKEVVGTNFDGYTARVKDKGTGIAAIGAQIDSTKRNLNTQLKRRAGISGGADLIDTSEPPPTKETPEDKLTKVLSTNIAKVDPTELDADDRAYQQIAKFTTPAITKGLVNDHFSPVVNRALETGIAPSQQRALDELQAAIRGTDDAARAKALDVLGGLTGANKDQSGNKASATGADAAVRAAAQAIIDEAVASAMAPPSAEDIGPRTQTVKDTVGAP